MPVFISMKIRIEIVRGRPILSFPIAERINFAILRRNKKIEIEVFSYTPAILICPKMYWTYETYI